MRLDQERKIIGRVVKLGKCEEYDESKKTVVFLIENLLGGDLS